MLQLSPIILPLPLVFRGKYVFSKPPFLWILWTPATDLSGACICRKILMALGSAFRTVSPSPLRAALIPPPPVSLLLTPVRTCCLDSPRPAEPSSRVHRGRWIYGHLPCGLVWGQLLPSDYTAQDSLWVLPHLEPCWASLGLRWINRQFGKESGAKL